MPLTEPQVLDGRAIASRIREKLIVELSALKGKPKLAILSFKSPASTMYQAAQVAQAKTLGIETVEAPFDNGATLAVVSAKIEAWNKDPKIHGIFVHQPMPAQIDPDKISAIIDPQKDVEGIHPSHSSRRFFGKARIGSCTALAVMELIESTGEDLTGKEAVVVGHSEIVGRPVGMLLLDKLATTTICHVGTAQAKKLEEHIRRAEVLVVATGKPRLIKGDWIRDGAIVIDVGINVVDGKVVGDVALEGSRCKARFITPVPGGVGPVTVMMVMKNAVEAFKLQQKG